MIRAYRHVVVDIGDVPASLPVMDRYAGEYLPEGTDDPETAPLEPSIYVPDSCETPSM